MGFLRDLIDGAAGPVPAPEPDGPTQAAPPWERWPGEPDVCWIQFSAYLQTAGSVRAFAQGREHAPTTIAAMASRWRWAARRAALTSHLDRARVESAEAAARAQGEQMARLAQEGLDMAEQAGRALELRGGLETMSAKDVLAWRKQTIELARLLRGEVTARVGMDLSGLSTEEIEALEALARKAGGGG